jgi:hypothetical protein
MERRVQLLPEAVQVFLGVGEAPEDIIPVLAGAAALARENALHNLIVISGFGDPASAEAVSQALEEMHALGGPSPFRIAFVAYQLPQYAAYHFAERYAQRFGILAKVLVSMRDAEQWLGLQIPASVRLRTERSADSA